MWKGARYKYWSYFFVAVFMLLISRYSYAQTNYGFEGGNLSNWTAAGGDAGVNTGLINVTYGGGKYWTIKPYGTYMVQLYPSGNVTFDNAVTSLGLSNVENNSIRNFMSINAGGGDPTPTNATWIKRTVVLEAGVTYKFAWNYLSTDYTPFNDGSMMTLVHSSNSNIIPTLNNKQQRYALLGFTNPGTGNYSTDSYGSTGWQLAVFTVPESGNYELGFATFNLGDTILSPMLFIDEMQGITELNGQPFGPIAPNQGSDAPVTGGGGAPTYPNSDGITNNQLIQKNAAKNRVTNIVLGNYIYIEEKIGSSGNSVTIEQSGSYNKIAGLGGATYSILDGDNNTLSIKQGSVLGKNLFEFSITGNTNSVTLWQARNESTGLVNALDSGGHYTGINIVGNGNGLTVKQSNSGAASSGHFAFVDVLGNSNQGLLKQSGNTEKIFFGMLTGNSNIFDITQQGTGNHYLDLTLTGASNNATINQKDSGNHKATVNLTNSGGANTLNLIQQGSTAQSINITQQCANLSGCSVTVTQGNGP